MRLGGRTPPPAPADELLEDELSPGEELFEAFFERFEAAGPLTLFALKAALEERPRPSFAAVPQSVRDFFEEIADRLDSDPE